MKREPELERICEDILNEISPTPNGPEENLRNVKDVGIIKVLGYNCKLHIARYSNGRVAISLVDAVDGSPIFKATVNVPSENVPEGYVAIKNYSENEGVLDYLVQAGVVGKSVGKIPAGYLEADLCKLLIKI